MQTSKKKQYKDKTLLVLDQGLFFDFALKLSQDFKQTYYSCVWESSYPGMELAVIGKEFKNGKELDTFDGYNFKRVSNPFDVLSEVDVCFAPDLYYGGLTEMLKESGIPTFAAFHGENLELDRVLAMKKMAKLGMDVAPYEVIVGLDNLREHLKHVKNKYIKISCYRNTFESFHHIEYKLSEPILDNITAKLGPLKDVTQFIICDYIKAVNEIGVDAFCVDGKLPTKMMEGVEIKDCSYCCSMCDVKDLAEGNKVVNEGLSKLMKEYGYRNFFSTEVRVTTDNKYYLIDITNRLGMPPNAIMQEYYSNLSEIIYEGAHGNLVDPKTEFKYGLECLMSCDWASGGHQTIYFPKEIRKYIKLINCVKINDTYHIMKIGDSQTIGSLVYPCNDLEKGKQELIKMAAQIKGYNLTVKTDSLDAAIEAYNTMINTK